MARFTTTISSPASAEEVFSYLSAFDSIAEWDPGVSAAKQVGDGPVEVGTVFEVTSVTGPWSIPLRYEVVELGPGHRIALRAETADFVSYDVITVTETDSGSAATYDADLALRGVRRPFDPFLRLVFTVIGRRAEAGLRQRLATLPEAVAA
jgi:uncharacterized protein YndB with AHSA1/START domain